jgi:hypothetical protein
MSSLPEARDSLSYWESRLHRLPRHAIRKRREARAMAERWRERVRQAEQAEYGPGFLGALFQLMAERRLPLSVAERGRRVAKVGLGVAAAVAVSTVVIVALICVAILVAIF